MNPESIVYGCIKDVTSKYSESVRRRANRSALLALPQVEQWPYLCQEMFSIPELQPAPNNFQTEVVHFGASYQAIEYEWSGWLEKFEALLKDMYWVSAIVHLETELTGTHTFTWETQQECHTPGSSLAHTRCEWSREYAIC